MSYETPQAAEDAYYDALESGDVEAMAGVWGADEEVACLLPMTPAAIGPQVQRMWRAIFEQGGRFDLQVTHLGWVEGADLAIHLVEERVVAQPGREVPSPIYATNVFRRGPDGWRLMLHQNSPTPPPPPTMPGDGQTAFA
ncbi:YybH family protein [Imhoffiella purpurea]|uniref:Alternative dihydrofolate reductase 3 n=1 Tax=Imhoffiella purpurea TaxID=1249627 RepID=W9V1S5_9GAMM|nr:nuclear transport factor 2 family protein [Imhoffiella purpurea]EXJ13299.1 Alternative dihydrofolate reductase 3 [Imhoffiella purpurea]